MWVMAEEFRKYDVISNIYPLTGASFSCEELTI